MARSNQFVSDEIRRLIRGGHEQRQAIAIALSEAGRSKKKKKTK